MIQRYFTAFFLLLFLSSISCQRLTDPLQKNVDSPSDPKPNDLPFYLQDSSWFSLAVWRIYEDSSSANLCYEIYSPDYFPTADTIVWSDYDEVPYEPLWWEYLGIIYVRYRPWWKHYYMYISPKDSSEVKFIWGRECN